MDTAIGFIGLGMMGKPMARNLLKAGHPLTVYDVNARAVKDLVADGASGASSPREVAAASDVVITMLPGPSDLESVVVGADGVVEGLRRGAVLVDMSTIGPQAVPKIAAAIRAKGGDMLDAPVSRGQAAAIAGTLSIMVGGDAEVLRRCEPILRRLGTDIFHCGDLGMGQVVKLVNNLMIGVFVPAISEALTFGLKAGAKLDTILEVIRASSASNWLLENFFPAKVFKGDFVPGFSVNLMHKDLGLAISAADGLGVPLPLAAISRQFYGVAQSLGRGEKDFTAVITLLEDATGVRVRH